MVEKHEPDKSFVYPYSKQKWCNNHSQSGYIWCLICKKVQKEHSTIVKLMNV